MHLNMFFLLLKIFPKMFYRMWEKFIFGLSNTEMLRLERKDKSKSDCFQYTNNYLETFTICNGPQKN